jgi:hypothetical protein
MPCPCPARQTDGRTDTTTVALIYKIYSLIICNTKAPTQLPNIKTKKTLLIARVVDKQKNMSS